MVDILRQYQTAAHCLSDFRTFGKKKTAEGLHIRHDIIIRQTNHIILSTLEIIC